MQRVNSHIDEALCEGEEAKDDPVGEPLNVILGLGCLEGSKGEVGGCEEANKVGEKAGEAVDAEGGLMSVDG